MKTCGTCKYHREYWDEVRGNVYQDGCTCKNDNVNWKGHGDSCLNDNIADNLVECAYYEEES